MVFKFLLLCSAVVFGLCICIILFFKTLRKQRKITNSKLKKAVYFRLAAPVFGVFFCCFIAAYYLPKTQYGIFLIGNYHFSKFLQSNTEVDALTAFYNWQRSGSKKAFLVAIEKIPENSTLWKHFIKRSSQLYHDKENPSLYLDYLENLQKKLTHPVGKSAINFEIGSYYMNQSPARALECFNTVISLNVNQHETQFARGNIYELQNLNPGLPAPEFKVLTIENQEFSRDNLDGKIVLIVFWSLKCNACVLELPSIKELHSSFKSENLVLLMVSLEHGNEVVDFLKQQDIPGHHILIGKNNSSNLLQKFNIQYIPTTYVIDQKGRIAYKNLHGLDLRNAVQTLSTHKE